jgi:hypothetical protein
LLLGLWLLLGSWCLLFSWWLLGSLLLGSLLLRAPSCGSLSEILCARGGGGGRATWRVPL